MDYTGNDHNGDNQGSDMSFFTAGAGNPDVNYNANPDIENIDLSNFQPNIPVPDIAEISDTPESSEIYRGLGNQAISAVDIETVSNSEKVVKMPPQKPDNQADPDTPFSDQDTNLLVDGKLSDVELKKLKDRENKLSHDGNIKKFYDYISAIRQKSEEKAA